MRDLMVGFACLLAALPAFMGLNLLRAQEGLSVLPATEEHESDLGNTSFRSGALTFRSS